MTPVLRSGPWEALFGHAIRLIDAIERDGVSDPFWTFGGGTVLMLRYGHRNSKDVDIFFADPQYLGYVTPRLSDVAEAISTDYVEAANYVKLIRPDGEIDLVAAPNLTDDPFETWTIQGRNVKVETAAEIVAKKMWHRGDRATARDLFDLALVVEMDAGRLEQASRWLTRHREQFLAQIDARRTILKEQFDAIDRLDFRRTYDECVVIASAFLESLRDADKHVT